MNPTTPTQHLNLALLTLASLACVVGRAATVNNAATVTSASPSAMPHAVTTAAPISNPTTPDPEQAPIERVRDTVRAWHAALDRRDIEALRPLYAAHVRMYGAEWARENAEVTKETEDTLRSHPEVHIALDEPIAVVHETGPDFTARFLRHLAASAEAKEYVRLRLRAQPDGHFAIVAEWSEPYEDPSQDAGSETRCFAAAAAAVHSVPAVLAAEERAARDAAATH